MFVVSRSADSKLARGLLRLRTTGAVRPVLLDRLLSQAPGEGSPSAHLRPLKILHRALVFLRFSARLESAKIAASSGFWIYLP
jgi:hypothetical protein